MKWIKRAWHDTVLSQVFAWSLIGLLGLLGLWLATLIPTARAFVFERLNDISRLQVIGWFALGVALGGVLGALIYRRVVRERPQPAQTSGGYDVRPQPAQTSGAFDVSSTTAEPERVNAAPAPAPAILSALSGAADLNDCFARMKALEGRFFEAEQYRKNIVGNRVFFTGSINSVSEREREREEGGVVLQLRHAKTWPLVHARYSAFFRTLAFQLRKDEVVTVVGTVKSFDLTSASLGGESLIPQSSGIVTTEPERVNPAPVQDTDNDAIAIAEGFKPTDAQSRVLSIMLNVYPRDIGLDEAHKTMRTLTPAHAERQMELLAAANVVRIRRVGESIAYYGVTPAGRDFAMAWLDELVSKT